jgi:aryl-alcohol dehydrogenase-like predicted oxidoreductase
LRSALKLRINCLDAADFYGAGHNEELIRHAIKQVPRDQVFLSVKFGGVRNHDGKFLGADNRPNSVRNFLAYSLQRLSVEYIDFISHWVAVPTVSIANTRSRQVA